MKTSLLFLLLVGVVAVAMPSTATAVYGGSNPFNEDDDPMDGFICGGWNPIYNIDGPRIQELGEWAVSEQVKRTGMNDGLKFVKVVSGEQQVVSGMNYWLFIQAISGNGVNGTYKAQVYEQSWTNTRELDSFGPAN